MYQKATSRNVFREGDSKLITVVFPDPFAPMRKLTSGQKVREASFLPHIPEMFARWIIFMVTSVLALEVLRGAYQALGAGGDWPVTKCTISMLHARPTSM
jgi:hypothetical protein